MENGNLLEGVGEDECVGFYQDYSGCSVQRLSLSIAVIIQMISIHTKKNNWKRKSGLCRPSL